VISESVISYISWDLIPPNIRLITLRADMIPARALGKLLQSLKAFSPFHLENASPSSAAANMAFRPGVQGYLAYQKPPTP